MNVELTSSLEDYLKTILYLENEKRFARPKDIAARLNVRRASVTAALHSLSEKNLIEYEPYSSVSLTPEGFRQASKIVHRHKVLSQFLTKFLLLPYEISEPNACRMEHSIDDETLERLIKFIEFIENCPRTGLDWLKSFSRVCNEKGKCENCAPCIEQCLRDFLEKQDNEPS
jgi:DtxR family Mn-dependent transcriptional regulator